MYFILQNSNDFLKSSQNYGTKYLTNVSLGVLMVIMTNNKEDMLKDPTSACIEALL